MTFHHLRLAIQLEVLYLFWLHPCPRREFAKRFAFPVSIRPGGGHAVS